jgi:hypothetical protein
MNESRRTSRLPVMALAAVAALASAVPAHADTYHFAVPTTVIQSALDKAITSASGNTNLFAFYDFYIRPAVASPGDVIVNAPTLVANYSASAVIVAGNIVDFASPIPTNGNGDMMTVNNYSNAGFDGGRLNAHYTYAAGDTKEPLISDNANVVNKSYEPGMTAELMPASFFYINVTVSGVLNTPLRFEVSANAYLFSSTNALSSDVQTKGQTVKGYFDSTGTVPEPGVMFSMAGGLALLAMYGTRRRSSR